MTKREALHQLIHDLPEEELPEADRLRLALEDLQAREAVEEAMRAGEVEAVESFDDYCRRRGV